MQKKQKKEVKILEFNEENIFDWESSFAEMLNDNFDLSEGKNDVDPLDN